MNIDVLDKKLKKMTYKIGLLSYFIKICKTELKSELNSEEFSGFLCSGIVPFMLTWIEEELMKEKDQNGISMEQLEHAKMLIQEQSELYFS